MDHIGLSEYTARISRGGIAQNRAILQREREYQDHELAEQVLHDNAVAELLRRAKRREVAQARERFHQTKMDALLHKFGSKRSNKK